MKNAPAPEFQTVQGRFLYMILKIKWVAKRVTKKKRTSIFNESTFFLLVEAMGVEPMSEKSSVQVSPGAGDLQHSRRATPIVRLALW